MLSKFLCLEALWNWALTSLLYILYVKCKLFFVEIYCHLYCNLAIGHECKENNKPNFQKTNYPMVLYFFQLNDDIRGQQNKTPSTNDIRNFRMYSLKAEPVYNSAISSEDRLYIKGWLLTAMNFPRVCLYSL